MEIANYIYSILKSNPTIILSWGFNTPAALQNNEGLLFKVNGFKHQGWVKVVYNEGKDLFIVFLLDPKMRDMKRINDVYFDQLIDVIDEAVERTNDYNNRVQNIFSN